MSERKQQPKSYLPALTLLRGVAALMVVGFHLFNRDFGFDPKVKTFFSYGHLGLDLFFLISGFVLPYAMYQKKYQIKQFFKFLLKRLVRIEPPYIISFVLIVCVRFVHCEIYGYNFVMDWPQFWTHFLYLNQYFGHEGYAVVFWTLAIEFQFYLIIGLTFPLFMHSSSIVKLATIAVFSVLCFWVNTPYNWFIFQYGFLFLLGILTFQFYVKHISAKFYSILAMLAVIGIFQTLGVAIAITAVLGVAAIFFIQREWKVTNFFGDISYSLYLTHTELSGWFVLYTSSYFSSKLSAWLVAFILCIGFAFVYHKLIEKPFLKLSKRIKY
ncbi:MAG: acyltransferase family protein [Flavobacteriales bacterium]